MTSSDDTPALLQVESLNVSLGRGQRATKILSDISLRIDPGEIVGLVGETGSGKTTLARTIVGLIDPKGGRVVLDGLAISDLRGKVRRNFRRTGHLQFVFQDPLRSLDPDFTVLKIVGEGLEIQGELGPEAISERVALTLAKVGLPAALSDRRPGQLSGGQRQRVAIARALAREPRLLICDEPVSALDASSRNHVLKLLDELRTSLNLPIIVISHDLSSLAGVADRVVVLYRGRIVEDGPIDRVFSNPGHPYTALLVASAPSVAHDKPLLPKQLRRRPDDAPAPANAGACVFAARCAFASAECSVQPPMQPTAAGWEVACHRHAEWREIADRRPGGPTPRRPAEAAAGR